jgi:hypothetical protein
MDMIDPMPACPRRNAHDRAYTDGEALESGQMAASYDFRRQRRV